MSATTEMPQHLAALEKGNSIRLRRTECKREIAKMPSALGRELVIDMILDPSELWEGARLSYVLRLPFSSGPKFMRVVRAALGTATDYRLKDLTERQRYVLVEAINGFGRKE